MIAHYTKWDMQHQNGVEAPGTHTGKLPCKFSS